MTHLFARFARLRRCFIYILVITSLYLTIKLLVYRYFSVKDPDYFFNLGNMQENKKMDKDQPGYFLKGKYPVLNSTFCKFNYGLPHKLDWSQVSVVGSPQLGTKSRYRVIYNAIERSMFDDSYVLEQVTYATHVTPEFLYHIVEIARFWDGPISVAAFVPNYDLDITMKLFSQLCRCYDGMSKVSVHLVYPKNDKPIMLTHGRKPKNNVTIRDDVYTFESPKKIFGQKNNNLKTESTITDKNTSEEPLKEVTKDEPQNNVSNKTQEDKPKPKLKKNLVNFKHFINIDFADCSIPEMGATRTFRYSRGLVYPVNVARNVARNASSTQYILVSDVELIPSEGLAVKFTGMVKKQRINGHYGVIPKWRLAFVIPVFEVEQGEDVPRNKSSLQQLYSEGKAVYFHRWVCSHCQKIPDLQAWLKDDPGNVIKPFAITKRQFPYHRWEPIYIATKSTPWYSETLSWEGRQDKMTQMLEMCLKSYDFVIVDGAFLCHSPGIKAKTKSKTWRYRHELVNTKQYDLIVKNLAEQYPANPKCRLG